MAFMQCDYTSKTSVGDRLSPPLVKPLVNSLPAALGTLITNNTYMTQKQNSEREWEKFLDDDSNWTDNGDPCITEALIPDRVRSFIKDLQQRTREEEYQFVLNILDGIDIADEQMGINGGTKAIRHALQSRMAGYGISLTPPTTTDSMSEALPE